MDADAGAVLTETGASPRDPADIGERRRIENELKLSEQKFRDLAETIPDLVWELDEKGKYSYVSPRINELLGYEAGELLGKDPLGFISGDDAGAAAEEFKRCLLQRTPFRGIELAGRHKDGRRRLLEASGNPFFDGEGRYGGYRGVTRDITARRLLEDENSIKALLLDSVKDAVFLHDLEGRIVYANEAAYVRLGYTEEEMRNAMYQRLLTPEAAAQFSAQTKYALEHGKAVFESEQLRADGGLMPVETHAHALELDGENFIMRVVMDITEWKEAESGQRQLMMELERTNAEISRFNGLVAHDLQLPLRMVDGYARQLKKRLAGKLDPAAETLLGYILSGAGLMQEMLDGLLHYLREGTRPETLREVDLDKVAGQALLLLRAAIKENGATVSCGRLPVVTADRSQMLRLLQNLIGNAVKFRGLEAPRISVSCASGETEHVFTVRDNGIGIPPRSLERLFGIFQRLHTREKYPGTGLGLALCRKIVENHGGRIWAESVPGKGAAFRFTLPRRGKPTV
ncbi:MAG: PAS domain S-box protein [Elusimicrobia bacterium]|nr:PAS domain S-box protein [Elusimicrobiota bacterium]